MQKIKCKNSQNLTTQIIEDCMKRKGDIHHYLEQLIAFWLREAPPYLFQLFYHNEGTELEYADLLPVEIIDLANDINIAEYLALYDGREIPRTGVPSGWEYPTIGDDLLDNIDEIVQRIAVNYIENKVLVYQNEDIILSLQQQYHVYLDDCNNHEVAEAIYMELKELLCTVSDEIFLSFLEKRKKDLLRDFMKENKQYHEFKIEN